MSRRKDEGAGFLLVLFATLCALAFLTSGCASVKEGWSGKKEHKPLLEQIVRMRAGYPKGPTNRACLETDWWGKCSHVDTLEYDFYDAAVRARFVELNFVCELGGRRYKIDPDAPQFVRYQRKRKCWLFCPEETTKVEPVPLSDTQRLLDGALTCYSERSYPTGIH